jgi:hypothetical protein
MIKQKRWQTTTTTKTKTKKREKRNIGLLSNLKKKKEKGFSKKS